MDRGKYWELSSPVSPFLSLLFFPFSFCLSVSLSFFLFCFLSFLPLLVCFFLSLSPDPVMVLAVFSGLYPRWWAGSGDEQRAVWGCQGRKRRSGRLGKNRVCVCVSVRPTHSKTGYNFLLMWRCECSLKTGHGGERSLNFLRWLWRLHPQRSVCWRGVTRHWVRWWVRHGV